MPGTLGKNLLLGPKPPNYCTFVENKFDHVYLVGEALRFDFTFTGTGPNQYEVRNFDGDVVASGAVSGTFFTIPARPCGWYKLYLISTGVTTNNANQEDIEGGMAVLGQVNYGSSVGDCYFCVIRSDSRFPARPIPSIAETAFGDYDFPWRGMSAMGPLRYTIGDMTDINNVSRYDAIPNIKNCRAIEDAWYTNPSYQDAARPRPLFVSSENAVTNPPGSASSATYNAAVSTVAAELYPEGIEWFEGPLNEPNISPVYGSQTPAQTVTQLQSYYTNIKAGHASAKVLAPNPVGMTGPSLGWLDEFLSLGGGDYLDGISLHGYNAFNGDISLARRCLSTLAGILADYGQNAKPLWQTELSPKAPEAGIFDVHLHGQWTALQILMQEQFGIPKERNNYWYDVSHGFWGWTSYWKALDKKSLFPGAVMFRTMSEELFGKTHTSAYDFGADFNDEYVGSLFTDASTGDKVAWVMTGGSLDGMVLFNVSGATSLVVVDAWGNEDTINAVSGIVTVPVRDMPCYVRIPAAVSATLRDFGFGTDFALAASGASISSTLITLDGPSTTKLNRVIARDQANLSSYWHEDASTTNTDFPFSTTTIPGDVIVEFSGVHTIERVCISAGPVWQDQSTFLSFEVQTDDGDGTWTTRATVTQTPVVVERFSSQDTSASFVDVFNSRRWKFNVTFSPVTTGAIRLLVTEASLGQYPSQVVQDRHPAVRPERITLRSIQAFGAAEAPVPRRIAALL